MIQTIDIREATAADNDAVYDIHCRAFGGDEEARLVEDLLADPTAAPFVSLVAERDGEPIGHVLFTAARITAAESNPPTSILAPLAVVPAHQKAGIGGALVEGGLDRLHRAGVGTVFVLGDPAYYGRFGFEPALAHDLIPPYPLVPEYEDGWRVRIAEGRHPGGGRLVCADALQRPELWGP